jgi:hypothetical protein
VADEAVLNILRTKGKKIPPKNKQNKKHYKRNHVCVCGAAPESIE